jgi:Tfp pilus assembly protein PilF
MINATLDAVRELYASRRYDDALSKLDRYVARYELTAEMLLLKGRLIQLSENGDHSLSDAKECFLGALRQDKDNVNALLELGWLCASVLGEPDEGKRFFSEAIEKCNALREEATKGMNACME